jgi:hypothetical protein
LRIQAEKENAKNAKVRKGRKDEPICIPKDIEFGIESWSLETYGSLQKTDKPRGENSMNRGILHFPLPARTLGVY